MNLHVILFIIGASTSLLMMQYAYAQSAGWALTVNVIGVPFGKDSVWVEITGPFGYRDGGWIANGPSVAALFTIPPNAIPVGNNYQVCAHPNGILDTILPTCQYFIHTREGDSSVTLSLS